jgi:hypothetical protein
MHCVQNWHTQNKKNQFFEHGEECWAIYNSLRTKASICDSLLWCYSTSSFIEVAWLFKKQDWKFFHSLSREKKMSKLSKRLFLQFLTCNSWLAILDLQFLTCNSWLAILDLQFLTCNSWQEGTEYHVPPEGTKCATGRHKMCHSTAQKDF